MWGKHAVAALSLTIVSACNTDPVWSPRQSVKGPVMRIDDAAGAHVPDINLAGAREVDLVEQVLHHRTMYYRTLAALHDFYRDRGYETKRRWADAELKDVRRVKPFRYLMSGEVPNRRLSPTNAVAEADALYERGLTLLKEGGHGIPGLFRQEKMTQALAVFKELVLRFPTSDKIDDAAFYCGEIHKEYFKGEERIAVRWYEKAVEWNPKTPHPARFQAAVVYDYRLHDRDRALELYHHVIKHERADGSNVAFSVRRIDQLTADLAPQVPVDAFTGQRSSSNAAVRDGG